MHTNPNQNTNHTSRSIIYSIAITLTILLIAFILTDASLRANITNDLNISKQTAIIRLLELAGESPETAPIAIIGGCENISSEDDCTNISTCEWATRSIHCSFDSGICPEGCVYQEKSSTDCRELANTEIDCVNLPGNFCTWDISTCIGEYPTPELCTGELSLPKSCFSKTN